MSEDKGKKDVKKLELQLEECQKLANDYLNGWKRAKADFINYKNSEKKIWEDFKKTANEDLLKKLLPFLDSLDEALKMTNNEGFVKIKEQLLGILRREGLEVIEKEGIDFDPTIHEAIEGKQASGTVKIIQRGYFLNNKLLRPAKIRINKK